MSEYKVGDRVKIVGSPYTFDGSCGVVKAIKDGLVAVTPDYGRIPDTQSYWCQRKWLRPTDNNLFAPGGLDD